MVSLISLPKKNCFKPSSLWGHIWENVLDIFLFKDSAPTFGRFCQGFSQIGTQSWKLTRKIREARLYCAPCIASNSRRRLQWVLSESFRNKDTVYRMMMMMMMICVNYSNISDFPRPQANSHWQLAPPRAVTDSYQAKARKAGKTTSSHTKGRRGVPSMLRMLEIYNFLP